MSLWIRTLDSEPGNAGAVVGVSHSAGLGLFYCGWAFDGRRRWSDNPNGVVGEYVQPPYVWLALPEVPKA